MSESLKAAGAALRRGGGDQDSALKRIGEAELESWLGTANVDLIREALLRATLQAVEAGLSDGEDAGTWTSWAFEALCERDDFESALAGAHRWSALHKKHEKAVAELRRALDEVDAAMQARARWLVALNGKRRSRRDALLPVERQRAWWFQARAECDRLLGALAGGEPDSAHVSTCAECRADLLAAKSVHTKRLRHLGEDDLWRFDSGLATDGERAVVEAHAGKCADCAQAVQLLEEADGFIAEALGETPGPSRPVAPAQRARHREVLAEQRGLRLVLIREGKRTKLLIERGAAVARAEVAIAKGSTIEAVDGAEGWEMELPDGFAGPAQVRVFLKGRKAPVTLPTSVSERPSKGPRS